jgi:hypothetical protein
VRGDEPQQRPAQPGPPRELVAARHDAREQHLAGLLGAVQQVHRAVVALVLDRDPRGGDEHEPLDALGEADRQLGADEPAHRVADHRDGVEAELVEQRVEPAPVAGDRDLLGGHLGEAEARQVDGDRAAAGVGDRREVLQPVLPRAAQPVDEEDRRARPDLDEVGRPPRDAHPALVLAPVDVEPRAAPLRPVGARVCR